MESSFTAELGAVCIENTAEVELYFIVNFNVNLDVNFDAAGSLIRQIGGPLPPYLYPSYGCRHSLASIEDDSKGSEFGFVCNSIVATIQKR